MGGLDIQTEASFAHKTDGTFFIIYYYASGQFTKKINKYGTVFAQVRSVRVYVCKTYKHANTYI